MWARFLAVHADPRWPCVVIFIENHLEDGVQALLLWWICLIIMVWQVLCLIPVQMPILCWGPKREDGRQEIKRVQDGETAPNGGSFSVEMVDRKETKNTKSSGRTEGYMGHHQAVVVKLHQAHGDGDVTISGAVGKQSNGCDMGNIWCCRIQCTIHEKTKQKPPTHKLCIEILHHCLLDRWERVGLSLLRSSTGKGYKKVYRDTVQNFDLVHQQHVC